jgi:hypothetical protein
MQVAAGSTKRRRTPKASERRERGAEKAKAAPPRELSAPTLAVGQGPERVEGLEPEVPATFRSRLGPPGSAVQHLVAQPLVKKGLVKAPRPSWRTPWRPCPVTTWT